MTLAQRKIVKYLPGIGIGNSAPSIPSLTSLLGTQIGVPTLTMPFSTMTPMTMGSRLLNMNCGSICAGRKKEGKEIVSNSDIKAVDCDDLLVSQIEINFPNYFLSKLRAY